MIRSLAIALALSVSSVLVGCSVDANEPEPETTSAPAADYTSASKAEIPAVETDTVSPSAVTPRPYCRPTPIPWCIGGYTCECVGLFRRCTCN